MSTLKSANKIEVISSIVLEEGYNGDRTLRIERERVSMSTEDPRTRERAELLDFILGREIVTAEGLRDDIVAELARRDEASLEKWGTRQGLPALLSNDFYIDADQRTVITDVLSGGAVSYDARSTLRAALSARDANDW